MEVGHTGPTGPEATEARSRPEPEPVADLTQNVEEDTAVDPRAKPDVSQTYLYTLYVSCFNSFTKHNCAQQLITDRNKRMLKICY